MAMSSAERQAAYLARLKAGIAPARAARKAKDRRSRPDRWRDAVSELHDLLNGWEAARESLPPSLADGAYAQKLDAMIALRTLVEELDAADCPKGFGRD